MPVLLGYPVYYLLTQQYRPAGGGALQTLLLSTHSLSGFTGSHIGYWEPRITQPMQWQRFMWGAGQTRGECEIGTGLISANNSDGGLDYLDGASFDNLTLLLEADTYPVDDSQGVFTLTGSDGPLYIETGDMDDKALNLYIRDTNYLLRNPVLTNVYAGNNVAPNGIEGDADLKNQRKPRAVGSVFNVTPVYVNKSKLVYQVDGQTGLNTGWTVVVKDMGFALTAGADYTSQADMEANAPVAGQYRVWPAGGCFRLGSTAVGRVTCDVYNPQPLAFANFDYPAASGTRLCEAHMLLKRLGSDSGGISSGGSRSVTCTSVTNIVEAGIYLTDETRYLEAMNQIATSMGVSWVMTATTIALRQLHERGYFGLFPTSTYEEYDTIALRRVQSGDPERGQPAWKVTLRWGRNYSPMQDSEIAGSARTGTTWTRLLTEWQEVIASDSSVKTQYPNAVELTIETSISNLADAQLEVARWLNLYKVKRAMYELDIPVEEFTRVNPSNSSYPPFLGDGATLISQRFNLYNGGAGTILQVIGKSVNLATKQVTFTLWG